MDDGQQAAKHKPSVAVVGGGIAGLTTAWALLNRGYEVVVYDERLHLGGKLGAHPARIPLPDPSKWPPDVRPDVESFINPADGTFRSAQAAQRFGKSLEAGDVPFFVLHALMAYYLRVVRQLGLNADHAKRWFEEEIGLAGMDDRRRLTRVKQPADPGAFTGVKHEWEITYGPTNRPRAADGARAGLPGFKFKFRATIYERDDGALALELSDSEFHEHCYHMYLNWYQNFWALMEDVGLERSTCFRPHSQVVHLLPGSTPLGRRTQVMTTLGDFSRGAENLLSGAAPVPDLFLWLYSMVDLVSHQFDPGRYLDRRSVHAFLGSRWYATDESVRFHEHLLAKAFAVPTYFSSAFTYRKYVEYTMAAPDPMLWVLNGNSNSHLFAPFEKRLKQKGLKIVRGLQVRGISWIEGHLRLKVRPSDLRGPRRNTVTGRVDGDDGEDPADRDGDDSLSAFSPDYIVVAVPPAALARITGDFRAAVPGLASVRKLQSAVTAALDLYFTRKLDGIPENHMVLRGSALGLTLMDNSQAWEDEEEEELDEEERKKRPFTHLNVAVTDFYKIEGMRKDEATAEIIEDLRRFIPFRDADVDFTRTYLQMNNGDPLFINEVGSEPWRPTTQTDIPKLFLAGDFCENDIGIVTVEGAVVSGLLAARAVQAQLRVDRPEIGATDRLLSEIPIRLPQTLPLVNAEAVKSLLLPQAALAYAASKQLEWSRRPERALTPRDLQFHLEQALQAPGAAASTAAALVAQAAQWVADLHARGRP